MKKVKDCRHPYRTGKKEQRSGEIIEICSKCGHYFKSHGNPADWKRQFIDNRFNNLPRLSYPHYPSF